MTTAERPVLLVNLTPHDPLVVIGEAGHELVLAREASPARLAEEQSPTGTLWWGGDRVPIFEQRYGAPEGLPSPRPDVYLVVSQLVVTANPERQDLLFPVNLVRDPSGTVTGCRGLARRRDS